MLSSVLHVLSPFVTACPDSLGDSELTFHYLDATLVQSGHHSIVVASQDSQTAGIHVRTLVPPGHPSRSQRSEVLALHRCNIERTLQRERVDLIHMHSDDFAAYLPQTDTPIVVTLHGDPQRYTACLKDLRRPRLFLQCTSQEQRHALLRAGCSQVLPSIIGHGAPRLPAFEIPADSDPFALCISAISPESRCHLALKAGKRAGVEVHLGGKVIPHKSSLRYHLKQILTRLDCKRRFLGSIDAVQRRSLLRTAACLVLPRYNSGSHSLLIAEAFAAGTPVVAFTSPEALQRIQHGVTGFVVRSESELVKALQHLGDLDRYACFAQARRRPSISHTVREYQRLYQSFVARQVYPLAS